MRIKKNITNYFNKKSKWSIASDIIIVALIIAFLIPQSRMQLGTWVNKAKMLVTSPSVKDADERIQLKKVDYEVVFHDLNGNSEDLSMQKNKIMFINFWATWCPPCVAEMPSIQELYNKYKGNKNIEFYIVSNEKQEKIRDFAKNKGYQLPFYTNKFQLPKVFSYRSIPTTFLISKSGKIVMEETGAADWGSKKMFEIIDKLLNEEEID